MREFLSFIANYWWIIVIVTVVLLAFWVAFDFRSLFGGRRGKDIVEVDAVLYGKMCDEGNYLNRENFELKEEIAKLKSVPKADRISPVIDWIGLNVVSTDYDTDARQFEINYMSKDGVGTIMYENVPADMAKRLTMEFDRAVKRKYNR